MNNPYESPQSVETAPLLARNDYLKILGFGRAVRCVPWRFTNSINGFIGQDYFRSLMGWNENTWLYAFLHGIVEGGIYGFGNGLLFIGAVRLFSQNRAHLSIMLKYFVIIGGLVVLVWVIGGALSMLFLPGYPMIFQNTPFNPKLAHHAGFAWTFGSLNLAVFLSPICSLGMAFVYIVRHSVLK